MDPSLVPSRSALPFPTSLMYFFYGGGPGTYRAKLQWLCRRQHAAGGHRSADSSSWSNAMPARSGGTTDCSGKKSTSVRQFLCSRPAPQASLPTPDGGCGCSTSPAISGFRPMWRCCIGCRTGMKTSSSAPVRTSIAAIALVAYVDGTKISLSIGLMGGGTGEKPRRRHCVPTEGLPVPDAKSANRLRLLIQVRNWAYACSRVEACVEIATSSFWSSIRRDPRFPS